MQEQRLTQRMLKYWGLIRKDNIMPAIEHFNSDPVRDLWPSCLLLSVDSRFGIKYKYEYVGDSITEANGRDLTHQQMDGKGKQFPGGLMLKKLEEMLGEQAPKEDNGHFINEKGQLVKYRACFLPFGNGKEITHIIVGLSFRAF